MIIRHGQSANNLLFLENGHYEGRSQDPVLTDGGLRQSELLAQFFAGGNLPQPEVIITSLFARAVQTAIPLADALDLPLNSRVDTFEIGGPRIGSGSNEQQWGGAPASELRAMTQRLVLPDQVDEDGWFKARSDTLQDAQARSDLVISELREQFPGDTCVALVSHQNFSQCLMRTILGLGHDAPLFVLDNTAATFVEFSDSTILRWMNRSDHLPDDLVTN